MTRKRFTKLMRAYFSKLGATDNREWSKVRFGAVLPAGKFKGVVLDSYQTGYDYFMYIMTEYNVWDDFNFDDEKETEASV